MNLHQPKTRHLAASGILPACEPRTGNGNARRAGTASPMRLAIALLIACFVSLGVLHAAPQIAGVAQVGEPARPGSRYVFLLLQFYDGAQPHAAYAVYHKPGMADAAGSFQRLGVIRPTHHIPTLAALMQRAAAAGFDNVGLEMDLNNILPAGPYGTLAAKVAAFFQAGLPGGYDLLQQQATLKVHPQLALALGQAYIARVPDSGPNTFEIRAVDPATEIEGPVVARVTSPALPLPLPAPEGLSERVETRPRGDLRVHLRWCTPEPLAEMTFHWTGFDVFRVPRQSWRDTYLMDPPVNMSRQMLLDALNHNPPLAYQINRLPVMPDADLPCPPQPASDAFFITDDNDTAELAGFEPGGSSFDDGFEATYFVAVTDHFGRIGDPSPGLPVRICDRLPPAAPSQVRVDNVYKQEGATDHALRISWKRDPNEEVKRYHVFRYLDPDDGLADRQLPGWPNTPNRIAILNNPVAGERVAYTDVAPGALTLPLNDGETRWFAVVAEDNTSCPNPVGLGNLSGISGTYPGALYDLANETVPHGRLVVPCCGIVAAQDPPGTFVPNPLVARRISGRIDYVEFRDLNTQTFLGQFRFGDRDEIAIRPDFQGNAVFQARFGTETGHTSDWVGNIQSFFPYAERRWTADYVCDPAPEFCIGGVVDPVDPETGDFTPTCVTLIGPPADAIEAALFRRLNDTGPLVLMRREKLDTDGDGINDLTELCELAPPANPDRACYFLQYFDENGNPSVVAPIGCIQTLGTEGFPVPRITHFVPNNPEPSPEAEALATLAWFCPRPGVDRFEIAITPPPPGSSVTFTDGNEAGVGATYGVFESDRLANGFLDGSPNFAVAFMLERGKEYRAKVRAVGEGLYGDRDTGEWSDAATIVWLLNPETGGGLPADCPVPWPALDVASLITDPARELEAVLFDWEDFVEGVGPRPTTELWIKVGCFEFSEVMDQSQPSDGTLGGVPARLAVEDLTPRLLVPLPFTVYLHQTSTSSRGTMLQVSHYVDEILTDQPGPGQLRIIDPAFAVRTVFGPNEAPCLWFRVRHPLLAGRSYRCSVVVHGEDREPIETLRTIEITVPSLP